ncbi:hypothetical protein B566_EDAN006504 [Ephemera danica]|nr:hypothetical protein B566_EDAN006504 [Ephemera danica]
MLRLHWMLLLVLGCGQLNEIITEFQYDDSNEELESSLNASSFKNRECLETFQKIISIYLATDFTVRQDDIVTVRDMQRSMKEMNATIEKSNEELIKKNKELNDLNLLVEKMKNDFKGTLEMCSDLKTSKDDIVTVRDMQRNMKEMNATIEKSNEELIKKNKELNDLNLLVEKMKNDFKSTLEMCSDLKTSKCNISCLSLHEARAMRVEVPYQAERETLLWRSAENGVLATVQNLISTGVNINATDGRYAMSTLIIACNNGHTDVVKLLIAVGANLNAKDRDNNTALILASLNNHTNVVKLLIDSRADVNAKSIDNNTALIWASRNGHTNVVRLLINAGANITIRNGRRFTALLSAVSYNRTEVVKILLEARNNQNVTDNEDGMSLKLAVQEDNVEIARMLLDSGVDVNFVDNITGNTPLHIAVSNRKMNSIHLLVSRGANLQARNNEHKTPLAIAENETLKPERVLWWPYWFRSRFRGYFHLSCIRSMRLVFTGGGTTVALAT